MSEVIKSNSVPNINLNNSKFKNSQKPDTTKNLDSSSSSEDETSQHSNMKKVKKQVSMQIEKIVLSSSDSSSDDSSSSSNEIMIEGKLKLLIFSIILYQNNLFYQTVTQFWIQIRIHHQMN